MKGVKGRMKGQLWSLDFASSIIIFTLMVAIVLFAWSYAVQNSNDQVDVNIIENEVLMISDSLIRVSGLPINWNESTVRVIGLVDEENVLNATKVTQFVNMNYTTIKTLLAIRQYEFYFDISYLNDTVMEIGVTSLTIGIDPVGQTSRIVVPVERYVMLNGKISKMKFYMWT